MGFDRFLQWLSETSFSATMRESVWAEPLVETVHVLTLTLFLGFVLFLDLRLLDVMLRHKRVSEMFAQFNPWLFGGFAVMIVTGLLLFSADPENFYSTLFFKIKMIMLVLAALNVVVFNATLGRRIDEWDTAPRTPWKVKLAGAISLVLWVCIVAAGRGIAYALPPP
jgi:putative copper export protein